MNKENTITSSLQAKLFVFSIVIVVMILLTSITNPSLRH